MRQLVIIGLASTMLCCATSHSQTVSARVGEDVSLQVGMIAAFTSELQISIAAIAEDSRCPADTTCAWAGQVKIQIVVTQGGNSSRLEIAESEQQSVGAYRIHFVSTQPPARSDRKLAARDYRITLRMERAG